MKPYVILWAVSAGRNLTMRDECLCDARRSAGPMRKQFVALARRHHRLGLKQLRDARRSLSLLVQKEAA